MVPISPQILICSNYTTNEEVSILLNRCFMAARSEKIKRANEYAPLFVLAFPENLTADCMSNVTKIEILFFVFVGLNVEQVNSQIFSSVFSLLYISKSQRKMVSLFRDFFVMFSLIVAKESKTFCTLCQIFVYESICVDM